MTPVSEQVDQERADKVATITSWAELVGYSNQANARGFSPLELAALKQAKERLQPRKGR